MERKLPHRKEPAVPCPVLPVPRFSGLDVHKNTISAGVLRPGHDVVDVEKFSSDDDAVRRLIARLGNPRRLRACYEAGPTSSLRCGRSCLDTGDPVACSKKRISTEPLVRRGQKELRKLRTTLLTEPFHIRSTRASACSR